MKLTARERHTVELSRELTEKMRACRLSGIDPYEHPRVREILTELGTVAGAQPLFERQEQIERELLDVLCRWCKSEDALKSLFAMIETVDKQGAAAIPMLTQDAEAQKLLREYAEIDEQIIDMLNRGIAINCKPIKDEDHRASG